jgi:hypothetical protein
MTLEELSKKLERYINPANWYQQPNGGGLVENTDTVADTTYVRMVSGDVQVFDDAWVSGDALVYDNIWASGDTTEDGKEQQ